MKTAKIMARSVVLVFVALTCLVTASSAESLLEKKAGIEVLSRQKRSTSSASLLSLLMAETGTTSTLFADESTTSSSTNDTAQTPPVFENCPSANVLLTTEEDTITLGNDVQEPSVAEEGVTVTYSGPRLVSGTVLEARRDGKRYTTLYTATKTASRLNSTCLVTTIVTKHQCEEPPSSVVAFCTNEFRAGSVCDFSCDAIEFELDSGVSSATCGQDYTWSVTLPTTCTERVSSPCILPAEALVHPNSTGQDYQMRIPCPTLTNPEGTFSPGEYKCEADGSWTLVVAITDCQPIVGDCQGSPMNLDTANFANGVASCSDGSCSISCDSNYAVYPNISKYECNDFGMWSPSEADPVPPTCVEICSDLEGPDNGYFTCDVDETGSYKTCSLSCNEGYKPFPTLPTQSFCSFDSNAWSTSSDGFACSKVSNPSYVIVLSATLLECTSENLLTLESVTPNSCPCEPCRFDLSQVEFDVTCTAHNVRLVVGPCEGSADETFDKLIDISETLQRFPLGNLSGSGTVLLNIPPMATTPMAIECQTGYCYYNTTCVSLAGLYSDATGRCAFCDFGSYLEDGECYPCASGLTSTFPAYNSSHCMEPGSGSGMDCTESPDVTCDATSNTCHRTCDNGNDIPVICVMGAFYPLSCDSGSGSGTDCPETPDVTCDPTSNMCHRTCGNGTDIPVFCTMGMFYPLSCDSEPCSSGYGRYGGFCYPCPSGTYATEGTSECVACDNKMSSIGDGNIECTYEYDAVLSSYYDGHFFGILEDISPLTVYSRLQFSDESSVLSIEMSYGANSRITVICTPFSLTVLEDGAEIGSLSPVRKRQAEPTSTSFQVDFDIGTGTLRLHHGASSSNDISLSINPIVVGGNLSFSLQTGNANGAEVRFSDFYMGNTANLNTEPCQEGLDTENNLFLKSSATTVMVDGFQVRPKTCPGDLTAVICQDEVVHVLSPGTYTVNAFWVLRQAFNIDSSSQITISSPRIQEDTEVGPGAYYARLTFADATQGTSQVCYGRLVVQESGSAPNCSESPDVSCDASNMCYRMCDNGASVPVSCYMGAYYPLTCDSGSGSGTDCPEIPDVTCDPTSNMCHRTCDNGTDIPVFCNMGMFYPLSCDSENCPDPNTVASLATMFASFVGCEGAGNACEGICDDGTSMTLQCSNGAWLPSGTCPLPARRKRQSETGAVYCSDLTTPAIGTCDTEADRCNVSCEPGFLLNPINAFFLSSISCSAEIPMAETLCVATSPPVAKYFNSTINFSLIAGCTLSNEDYMAILSAYYPPSDVTCHTDQTCTVYVTSARCDWWGLTGILTVVFKVMTPADDVGLFLDDYVMAVVNNAAPPGIPLAVTVTGSDYNCTNGFIYQSKCLSYCPDGMAYVDGQCRSCYAWEYYDSGECLACPSDVSTITDMSAPVAECISADCPAGQYSHNGRQPCRPCAAETYQTETGQTYCLPCLPGQSTFYRTGQDTPCDPADYVVSAGTYTFSGFHLQGNTTMTFSVGFYMVNQYTTFSILLDVFVIEFRLEEGTILVYVYAPPSGLVPVYTLTLEAGIVTPDEWNHLLIAIDLHNSARGYINDWNFNVEMDGSIAELTGDLFSFTVNEGGVMRFSRPIVSHQIPSAADEALLRNGDIQSVGIFNLFVQSKLIGPALPASTSTYIAPSTVDVCASLTCDTCSAGTTGIECSCPSDKKGPLCTEDVEQGTWTDWIVGDCSVTCGLGTRTKTRSCQSVNKYVSNCDGSRTETETCDAGECAACPSLSHPDWNCTTTQDKSTCTPNCPAGEAFTLPGLSTYTCGPATDFKWTPNNQLLGCTKIKLPKKMSISVPVQLTASVTLTCAFDIIVPWAEATLSSVSTMNTCSGCTAVIIVGACGFNSSEIASYTGSRRKRATVTGYDLSFTIPVADTADLDIQSFYDTNTVTPALQEVVDSIAALQITADTLQANPSTYLNVEVNGVTYSVDPASVVAQASIECNDGYVVENGNCVECPTGTAYSSTSRLCVFCEVGSYQDQTAQSSCTACPSGQTTSSVGSTSASDCTGTVDDSSGDSESSSTKTSNEDNTGTIVAAVVVPVVVIAIAVGVGIAVKIHLNKKGSSKGQFSGRVSPGSHAHSPVTIINIEKPPIEDLEPKPFNLNPEPEDDTQGATAPTPAPPFFFKGIGSTNLPVPSAPSDSILYSEKTFDTNVPNVANA